MKLPLRSLSALAVAGAALAQSARERIDAMQFGPFVTQTIDGSRRDNTALKGVAVRLGDDAVPAGALFDTELLRLAALWNGGFLQLRGTPYDGSHGPHSRAAGTTWFDNAEVPGWSLDGSFADPRPIPGHGTLPRALGRYLGMYRDGSTVVFHYQVAGSDVLERIATRDVDGARLFVRSLQLAPCSVDRALLIDRMRGDPASPLAGFDGLHSAAEAPAPRLVTVRRTEGSWADLPWGEPRAVKPARDDAFTGQVLAALAPPAGGDAKPESDDKGKPLAFAFACPIAGPVMRIHLYASEGEAVQRFRVLGGPADAPADPRAKAWTEIAAVDTSRLGGGGNHGVAIARPDGTPLGTFARLLLLSDGDRPTSLAFDAIDVLGADHGVRTAKSVHDLVAVRGSLSAAAVEAGEVGRTLRVPKGAAQRFDIVYWHGADYDLAAATAAMAKASVDDDLARHCNGGPGLWPQTVVVAGVRAADDQAYVVDTVPVPFDNPYASWMRTAAFDFFADGKRAAISTWNGDVWLVSGLDDDLDRVHWKRFATGLFDPLGLRIVDDVVYTLGRDGITRLHDLNADGEADYYEAFNHDVLITASFHEFAFDLHTDPQGNFYFSKAGPVRPGGRGFDPILPHHGTILKVSADGSELSVYATGFRAPNGIGVGPDGQVTSGDNEGTWMPKCRLSWVTPGSFNGCVDTAHRPERPTTYDRPLLWLPHDIDNSSGSQVWVTSNRWGPLEGDLLHLSYGTCSLFLVMKETVNGQIQGGAVRFPLAFASSCMRARFNPGDGQLWVCGLKGWQTSAAQDGGFQRVRYTGRPLYMPVGLATHADGVSITFSDPLDPEVAGDPEGYAVQVWNYVWGEQYGSPHISTNDPEADMAKMGGNIDIGYRNSDVLAVKAASLSSDGRTVRLRIEGMKPVMQMQIQINVDAADGELVKHTIWNTVHELPADGGGR